METPKTLSGRCTEAVMDALHSAGIRWDSTTTYNRTYTHVLAALERVHGDSADRYVFPDRPVAGGAQLQLDALLVHHQPGSALRAVLGPGYTPRGSIKPGKRPGKG